MFELFMALGLMGHFLGIEPEKPEETIKRLVKRNDRPGWWLVGSILTNLVLVSFIIYLIW